ncbi:hypothetical protein M0813_24372 [Anaeramoeba flamelloides]|uniref:Uncharacterized protein n=1 Tax=Anaeramoeba flamelloides TaxID=1746091 RepID=A0ABQ8Y7R0_9EUKA|nr:hypothetical protein M0813_30093 [Anaeramoeba flamelloides]KAJ6240243.1 hypothetical protein M0813_24372 [Anaeramoeba flamelloides]
MILDSRPFATSTKSLSISTHICSHPHPTYPHILPYTHPPYIEYNHKHTRVRSPRRGFGGDGHQHLAKVRRHSLKGPSRPELKHPHWVRPLISTHHQPPSLSLPTTLSLPFPFPLF